MKLLLQQRKSAFVRMLALLIACIGTVLLYGSPIAAALKSTGDLNNDSKIDRTDINLLIGHFRGVDTAYDVNGDGKVNIYDLSLVLSGFNKAQNPPPVTPPVTPVVPPANLNAKFHVIYLSTLEPATNDNAINKAEYKILSSNPNVAPSMRTYTVAQSNYWESQGYSYYYTVASSDITSCANGPQPYASQASGDDALKGAHNQGLYLHEVGAIYAACNGWNWGTAIQKINWPLVNEWVTNAKSHGKKVVWSEPAAGWGALMNDPTANSYLTAWGNTIVPTFATNFSHAPTNKVIESRTGAVAAAQRYGSELGESVQSWYWIDPNWSYTSADATTLMSYGYAAGTTYYQIEGTTADMKPKMDADAGASPPIQAYGGATYINGVNAFVAGLTGSALPVQSGAGAPLPTAH